MQNQRDHGSKSDAAEDKLFRRLVIILLILIIFIAVAFGIYQGLKILRTPDGEATTTPPPGAGLSPDLQATATAGCAIFMQQFPGTPCPDQQTQSLLATATAACLQFNSQFPGTPCP